MTQSTYNNRSASKGARSIGIPIYIYSFICLLALYAHAAPTSEQIRKAALDYVLEDRQAEGIEKIAGYVGGRLEGLGRPGSRELGQLAVAAQCVRFMEISLETDVRPEMAEWILGSAERLHLLIDLLEPEDDLSRVLNILEGLHATDPEEGDSYFALMAAIAVVLDKSDGPPGMHGQMGEDLLSKNLHLPERYDYFKTLYSSGKAKIEYGMLGARELVFVVHVPVPVEELEWALENASQPLEDWGENYHRIQYDHDRLKQSRYIWDQGTYTLAAINNRGGICVDQAYFAVITARAFGIPAIFFSGAGNSANHAWFSFMKGPGDWVLDIGRYQNEKFTTGHAINPQTNREMTDHDLGYTCERSLHSPEAKRAALNMAIASVLFESHPKVALKCAREARGSVKRYLQAWEIETRLLIAQEEYSDLLELFGEQKDAFRKYPYILADSAERIAEALRTAGRDKDATRLMRSLAGAVDDDRDDITYDLETRRIEAIVASGNMKKARKEMEQMLEEPEYRGNKSLGLIVRYVELTGESGQTREAVRFLEDYIKELVQGYNFPPSYKARLWLLLKKAYENNGDQAEAADLARKIERLEGNVGIK